MNDDLINIEDIFDQFVAGEINEKSAFREISRFILSLISADYVMIWINEPKSSDSNWQPKITQICSTSTVEESIGKDRYFWNFSQLIKNHQLDQQYIFHNQKDCENLILKGQLPRQGAYSVIYNYREKPIGGITFFRIADTIAEGIFSQIFYYQAIIVLLLRSMIYKNRIKQLAIDEVHYKKDYNDLKQNLLLELKSNERELKLQSFRTRELNQMLSSLNEKFSEAGKIAKIGGWEYDLANQTFIWDDEAYRIHNLTLNAEITIEKVISLIDPVHRDSFSTAFENLVKNYHNFDIEVKIMVENRKRWIRIIGKMMQTTNGLHYYGMYQDIDEMVRDQDRISDLTHLFENVPEPLAIINYEGFLTNINPAFTRITGYTKTQLTSQPFTQYFHPDDLEKAQSEFEKIVNDKQEKFEGVYRFQCNDGSFRYFSWNARHNIPKKKIYAVAQDLTETYEVRAIANENEQLYKSIAKNFPFGTITITNEEGLILFSDGNGYRNTEIKPQNLIGKNINDVSENDFKANFLKCISFILAGETRSFELNTLGYHILYIISPLISDNGKIRVMIVALDISPRKKIENELKRSRAQYRSLVNSSPFGIITLLNHHIVFANPESVHIFGYEKHIELIDKSILDFAFEPREFKKLINKYSNEAEGFPPLRQKFIRKDGKIILLDLRIGMIAYNDQPVLQLVMQDVTEAARIEEEKLQLQHLVQESVNEIYVLDSETLKFLFVNQSAIDNLKIPGEEIINLTPIDIMPGLTGNEFRMICDPLTNRKKSKIFFESSHCRSDGSNYPVEVSLEFVQWNNKNAYLAIVNDITEIKNHREQHHEIQKNLSLSQKVAKMGGWEFDLDSKSLTLTSEFLEIFGMNSKQLIQKKWSITQFKKTFIDPSNHLEFKNYIKDFPTRYNRKFIAKKELKGQHRMGHEIFIEVTVVFKNKKCLLGVVQDITEKYETTRQLKNSENNLQALFDSTTQDFILMDEEFRLINFNKLAALHMKQVSNLPLEKGKSFLEYFNEEKKAKFTQRFEKALSGKKIIDQSEIDFNGIMRYYSIQLLPVKNDKDKIYAVALVSEEITESKNQEKRIIRLNERLKFASEIGNVGWWEWDYPSGQVIFDDKKVSMLDHDPKDFTHVQDFLDIIHPDDYDQAITSMKNHFMGKSEAYEVEYRLRKKDGSYKWLFDKGFVTKKDSEGKPLTIKGAIFDIHDLKTSQETLRMQNEELTKTNHELDNFVYRISHDLRAPLASSLGLISLTIPENDILKIKEYLNLQARSLNKMDAFIKDIIDFSRNIRTEVKNETINVQHLIVEIFNSVEHLPNMEQVDKKINLNGNCCIQGDLVRLNIILSNLISNAIKYSRKNTPDAFVEITLSTSEHHAEIMVRDNGIGIRTEHCERIFDMFYRATDHNPGEGIGLYIVKDSIEKLGGSIKVQSVYGQGSTFTVTLPQYPVAKTENVQLESII